MRSPEDEILPLIRHCCGAAGWLVTRGATGAAWVATGAGAGVGVAGSMAPERVGPAAADVLGVVLVTEGFAATLDDTWAEVETPEQPISGATRRMVRAPNMPGRRSMN